MAKQGLTFPIRGTRGETAMFSINCEMSDREWAKQKRSFLEKFWIIACSFHQSVLERECHVAKPKISLTPREMEILKWAAAGKSEEETSIILGITKRTVEFMMSNVRGKLGASNKVEAAVKAVRLNLI